MHTCIFCVQINVYKYTYIYIDIFVYIYMCMFLSVYMCMTSLCIYVHVSLYVCIKGFTHFTL